MSANLSRGYIYSGNFRGNRIPQHIQNQIIRQYCSSKELIYILSRAEYSVGVESTCQLWAALNEEFKHVVFYSVWQLPMSFEEREKVYQHIQNTGITIHFACEGLKINSVQTILDIEILISTYELINNEDFTGTLEFTKNFLGSQAQ